jgi:transcriptional regulator with XRE-family HTH domain
LVGEEIRSSRRELGLTQTELANRLEVSAPYIAKVEGGRANLTIGQLANIAGALGVGLEIHLPTVKRETITLSQPHATKQP